MRLINCFILIVILIFTQFCFSQNGTALLKIVVDDSGKVRVFDMKGKELNSKPEMVNIPPLNALNKKGIYSEENLTNKIQVHSNDPNAPEMLLQKKSLQDTISIRSKGGTQVQLDPNSSDPEMKYLLESFRHTTLKSSNFLSEDTALSQLFRNQKSIPSSPSIPENMRSDPRLQSMPQKDNDASTVAPQNFKILESTHPEAILHVEEKKLKKTTLDPNPNLTVETSNCNFSYSSPNLTLSIRVKNNGHLNSVATTYIAFYLSDNLTISYLDHLIGYQTIPTLQVNSYSDISLTANLTQVKALPSGTYYVCFILDLNDVILEENEDDNHWYWQSPTIYTAGGPTAPNLTKYGAVADTFYLAGNYLTMKTAVLNSGNATAAASYLYPFGEPTF